MVARRRATVPIQARRPQRRSDPKPRHLDGSAPWARLLNREPGRHYVYAYIADPDFGKEYYLSIGYRPEVYVKGGVRPAAITEPHANRLAERGEEIVMRGMLLVSCSQERFEEIQQYGPDGQQGYEWADAIEQKITGQKGGIENYGDELRSALKRGYFDLGNDTSPAEHGLVQE